jgi:hypothetical protein
MKVDILQWLKDTGGKNADSRFSKPLKTENTDTANTAKISLNSNQISALKSNRLYDTASQLLGFNKNTDTVDILSNLAARPLQAVPQAKTKAAADTNRVQFTQVANASNKANVTGSNNVVDFTSNGAFTNKNTVTINGNQNTVRGYNGGQTSNLTNITGNTNRVMMGQNTATNTMAITGNNSFISLGDQVSSNKITVTGNNVSISVGSQGSGSNSGWTMNINAGNVNVSIVNGKASVNTGAMDISKYNISVNNETKTISVGLKELTTP